jgi:hypothetical protein
MALDEALLEAMPRLGVPVLRFYGWTEPAASFGYFQKYSEVERLTPLRPLVRRPTAGGIVPHDADWTYSLAFPTIHEWYSLTALQSYERIHRWILSAFVKVKIETALAPERRKAEAGQCFIGHEKFDLLWKGKKIAGAAQRRTRDGLLNQGSIQPPQSSRIEPLNPVGTRSTASQMSDQKGDAVERVPIFSERRFVESRPFSLTPATPLLVQRPDWENAMRETASDAQWNPFPPDEALAQRVQQLILKKYSLASYNRKR